MLDIDGWFFSILQRLIELLPSILDRMGVCIDYHDQRSFRFALSEAVCAYFLGKPVPHPTFGALSASGGKLNPYLMSQPVYLEISEEEHFVMVIFQKHDDLRWLTHPPIPARSIQRAVDFRQDQA